jgi:hypothetical protein
LAIRFALQTFAQQTNTPDPQLREALAAYCKKEDEAWTTTIALAALYTEDAVEVNDTGPIYGREAIEKHSSLKRRGPRGGSFLSNLHARPRGMLPAPVLLGSCTPVLPLSPCLPVSAPNSAVDPSLSAVQFGSSVFYGDFCSNSSVDNKPGSRI